MEIKINSFSAVKLMNHYDGNGTKIEKTGVYYNIKKKTFDCWFVNAKKKLIVVQLNEKMTLEDKQGELYETAIQQLEKFAQRN